ncbi:hypothetical protein M0657_001973 [Pyricularia oryzae]|uniref:Uncharacterized protein n=1 Tax=Pyricularia oryzae TaxID=318829 RepID=A0A4P7N6D7_PYROR|nr:hypothetical protein M9X92_002795 [Pyricularia oryzae]KAI7929826.1 hypothetical protein M0657_001973 [Pyricularia oryzae]QBZ55604.1 hypothetical protein PoMZ_00504 [Pyricularia oryzae]
MRLLICLRADLLGDDCFVACDFILIKGTYDPFFRSSQRVTTPHMTKFERTGGHNRAPPWPFHQKQDCTNPVGRLR